jgi:hypothetical protein
MLDCLTLALCGCCIRALMICKRSRRRAKSADFNLDKLMRALGPLSPER